MNFLGAYFRIMDTVHTVLIAVSIWEFTITHFGDSDITDTIIPSIPSMIIVTGLITITANLFYGWRLHKLSKQNWWISGPIAFLSISRLGLLMANAPLMIIEKSFSGFAVRFKYYYLRDLKEGYLISQKVLDGIVIFTINDGCAVAIAAAACWVAMPNNFVWLSIYFTIAKCKPIFLELE
ncbi:hypothetical protein FB45DRAFT_1025269 [Roridomyces roridus]|uniref:Uncharacterized protein n=1 Tax=Roridomyces roridus TaxID=1738132 RepID=A0AAD7C4E1_9AGAR|nr:hypothetical protein FB45DRAFT_1025269 [Roridomyces roridus]